MNSLDLLGEGAHRTPGVTASLAPGVYVIRATVPDNTGHRIVWTRSLTVAR